MGCASSNSAADAASPVKYAAEAGGGGTGDEGSVDWQTALDRDVSVLARLPQPAASGRSRRCSQIASNRSSALGSHRASQVGLPLSANASHRASLIGSGLPLSASASGSYRSPTCLKSPKDLHTLVRDGDDDDFEPWDASEAPRTNTMMRSGSFESSPTSHRIEAWLSSSLAESSATAPTGLGDVGPHDASVDELPGTVPSPSDPHAAHKDADHRHADADGDEDAAHVTAEAPWRCVASASSRHATPVAN